MKPGIEAFVDEEAGFDVGEKVRRRLQHFIDRKVATQFEPLLAMGRDEALTGLARGFAFRLAEALGVLPREAVAEDVKALDQEARSALRKHGVRFGQFTIFMPLLLKPAPTRLRLVLWSLANGLQEFPESPPPGLVTIPNLSEVPRNHYTLSGYHPAGARAIRIDMLERLADLLRAKDSRAGFEATPEMLSITGMTLDQFADLMAGLGYRGEKGERPKHRPEPVAPVADEAEAAAAAPDADAPVADGVAQEQATEVPVADGNGDAASADGAAAVAAGPASVETEAFYTFTWAPRPRGGEGRGPRGRNDQRTTRAQPAAEGAEARAERPPRKERPEGERRKDAPREGGRERGEGFKGKPKGKGGKPGGDRPRESQPKSYEARPPRETRIDPDSPFAVLAALKTRS
jgi:ATP-dependent RNA helicase SUPV3L1/SUV3